MKTLVFLVSILAALPLNEPTIVQKSCQTTCSGKSDNFVEFNSYALMLQGKSPHLSSFSALIAILVDLTQCGFETVENILTWMSCNTQCFMIGGVQDIYKPGPNGFKIYPHLARTETLTPEHMKNIGAEVHYQVTGSC